MLTSLNTPTNVGQYLSQLNNYSMSATTQMVLLTLVSSTPSSNGGFILKLQNKSTKEVQTPFGMKKSDHQETYYMKVADNSCKVGFQAEMDLSQFNIVERPYTIDDANSDINGQTIQLKWLQIP